MPRCSPGDLCIIVESGIHGYDRELLQARGLPVTVIDVCPAASALTALGGDNGCAWHFKPELKIQMPAFGMAWVTVHSLPDCCLRPIGPGASEKTAEQPKELSKA